MGVFRFRRCARAVAVVLVLAALPGLSHLAADDPACLSAFDAAERHDETRHGVRAGSSHHQQDHCAICHWFRSLRAPRAGPAIWARQAPPSVHVQCAAPAAPFAPALDRTPARAPPSNPR